MPLLVGRVVDGAVGGGSLWAPEASAAGEAHVDIETTLLGIGVQAFNSPRIGQAEGELEERVGGILTRRAARG
ncbi:MAG: hypothetical protein M3082_09985 [Candidatus Dormibacteraeota bacterium]|nr:hypothetical protein [Candidatus Dormibacteraeota bacterium]